MKVRFKTNNKQPLLLLFEQHKISHFIDNEFIIAAVQETKISSIIELITANKIQLDEVRQLRTLEELFLKWTE